MVLFERNLTALGRTDSRLAERLRKTAAATNTVALKSTGGLIVPARRVAGRERPFHSTVDPLREGTRTRRLYPGGGYFVFLGLGGGYQTGGFLDDSTGEVQRLVIIERDPAFLRAVMSLLDLSKLFSDSRVRLLAGESPEQIRLFLTRDYLPIRDGALRTIPLRSSVDADPEYFAAVTQTCREAVGILAADAAVQARFGRRWFLNTLANLETAGGAASHLPRATKAIVLAAGPSLESRLPELPALRRRGWYVIATDTSLPLLQGANLFPNLVLSLDCQHISYHHFLRGLPPDVPLALDLASPPLLSRLARRKFFFSGGHPFSRYLASLWRRFPLVDTSGGNVTQAAVSLARLLGAEEILVFGADFSYPAGKPYARGTYLYPYYRSRETRCRPLESLFFSFLRRGGPLMRSAGGYTTAVMDAYRQNLETAVESWAGNQSRNAEGDLRIRLPAGSDSIPAGGMPDQPQLQPLAWRDFLADYAAALAALPSPQNPLRIYLEGLSPGQHDLWMTQLPAAAATARFRPGLAGATLLESTRAWALSVICRVLNK